MQQNSMTEPNADTKSLMFLSEILSNDFEKAMNFFRINQFMLKQMYFFEAGFFGRLCIANKEYTAIKELTSVLLKGYVRKRESFGFFHCYLSDSSDFQYKNFLIKSINHKNEFLPTESLNELYRASLVYFFLISRKTEKIEEYLRTYAKIKDSEKSVKHRSRILELYKKSSSENTPMKLTAYNFYMLFELACLEPELNRQLIFDILDKMELSNFSASEPIFTVVLRAFEKSKDVESESRWRLRMAKHGHASKKGEIPLNSKELLLRDFESAVEARKSIRALEIFKIMNASRRLVDVELFMKFIKLPNIDFDLVSKSFLDACRPLRSENDAKKLYEAYCNIIGHWRFIGNYNKEAKALRSMLRAIPEKIDGIHKIPRNDPEEVWKLIQLLPVRDYMITELFYAMRNDLKFTPPLEIFKHILRLHKLNNDDAGVISLFQSMDESMKLSEHIYEPVFESYCRLGQKEKALEIFASYVDHCSAPRSRAFEKIMELLITSNDPAAFLRIYSLMIQIDLKPTNAIFEMLAVILGKLGKVEEIKWAIQKMKELNCTSAYRYHINFADSLPKSHERYQKMNQFIDLLRELDINISKDLLMRLAIEASLIGNLKTAVSIRDTILSTNGICLLL